MSMIFPDLSSFLDDPSSKPLKGPMALIFVEDDVEVDSTIRHHITCGFKTILVFGGDDFDLAEDLAGAVTRIRHDMLAKRALVDAVNAVIEAAPDQWVYYGYNAEYFFYPFCESRTVGEMAVFSQEERRSSMLTYVVDLYAADLNAHPSGVALEDAHLDKSGYYALARSDKAGNFRERQLDFFGGLRWRFEEHVPSARRKIDRISLFRAKPGLKIDENFLLNDQEYNTYACPWHHSITTAVASFRTAKALKRNPGSSAEIHSFKWHNSVPFEWHSGQLMNLGLMEPGQWF